jgi:hypothetical protein
VNYWNTNYLTTGGPRTRDMVSIQTHCTDILAGGPLDAPDIMPAGAMNSTQRVGGPWFKQTGTPAPDQSECAR